MRRKGLVDVARRSRTRSEGAREVRLSPEEISIRPDGDPEPGQPPAIRASEQDRDAVVQRLQQAFAERRLDDDEFDERMRAAPPAPTSADLERLPGDPPAA